jgi:hypothetical protein
MLIQEMKTKYVRAACKTFACAVAAFFKAALQNVAGLARGG